ncbi:MAG: divalent metal cation transporter [Candidatus Abyssobacteria bacterium SURF_17]|uniref:Divalent metal cation transporter n=1 Tax=Candidatus Abyssobacteria bacterium SURF_17 TaxID=2093361 RepID=A0A419ET57_9BACT|nr:MAG: divalent metal cation transporter [Candidatus Abyssubacteria bacterium SURF_17]
MKQPGSRIGRLFLQLGPGLIWAMMAIGQTHIILATYSGTNFVFSLLWVILLAHVLSYPVFEYGPRYAVATGESLVDAYLRVRRGRTILLAYFGIVLATLPFLGSASLLSVSASVLYAGMPQVSFNWWCGIIAFFTVVLVFAGRYKGLELTCLVMSAFLLLGTAAAFCYQLPRPADVVSGALIPAIPAGSLVTLVALMRMPTDAPASILHSLWALKKRDAWIEEGGLQAGLKKSLLDLRIGFTLSFLIAIFFVSVGAMVLHPRGLDLEGLNLAMKLSQIYTETVGPWTFPLFIAVAFFTLWGSYYASTDGAPRLAEKLLNGAMGKKDSPELGRFRIIYTIVIVVGGLLLATTVQRPVFLVILAISTGLISYPLIYVLNIWAVTRLVDEEFRPSRLNLIIAYTGVAYSLVGVAMLLLVRVFKVWG